MSPEAARQALFDDVIATVESRPAVLLPEAPDASRRRGLATRAEALLRALALVEDGRPDEPEEHGQADPALRRLEAKVDLLVSLVGSLLQREQTPDPLRTLQWSARGASIELPMDAPALAAAGAIAMLRLHLSDALPEPLQLPVRVLAVEPSPAGRRLFLQFDHLPPSLEALLERHLFRTHRRAIAESRRQR
ncbi:MAG: PilZ domain-containing protein [Lysobacter sp.]|nr:MAG: PilZ domain-containing protein [Lysobacter sp.]